MSAKLIWLVCYQTQAKPLSCIVIVTVDQWKKGRHYLGHPSLFSLLFTSSHWYSGSWLKTNVRHSFGFSSTDVRSAEMDGAIKIQPLKWKWENLKTSFIVVFTIAFSYVTHCKMLTIYVTLSRCWWPLAENKAPFNLSNSPTLECVHSLHFQSTSKPHFGLHWLFRPSATNFTRL